MTSLSVQYFSVDVTPNREGGQLTEQPATSESVSEDEYFTTI